MYSIALVGRPNVGKSTLLNRLTNTRAALVADVPGVTRDRQYGLGQHNHRGFLIIDCGGFEPQAKGLDALVVEQIWQAVEEADAMLLIVDGREGLCATDEELMDKLRCVDKPLYLLVNKTEGMDTVDAEFHRLGVPWQISALHNRGISSLLDRVLETSTQDVDKRIDSDAIKVAVIGRPNVGKSTLINCLIGKQRLLTCDIPGVTRDCIEVPWTANNISYRLIDTAGVRRRSKTKDYVERISVIKTMQAIERANVVILLLDAEDGIVDWDTKLLGLALVAGVALILVVNKWDQLGSEQRTQLRSELDRKLKFINYAPIYFVSAIHGSGIKQMFKSVLPAWNSAMREVKTPQLNKILRQAVTDNPPPLVHRRRIKLRYVHQGGRNPPLFIVHGSRTDEVSASYIRYLSNRFRSELRLFATPVKIEFRNASNPYSHAS